MSEADTPRRQLLLEIARCPNAAKCVNGGEKHACAEIVSVQTVTSLNELQVPEPWSGRLATARLLFISSNPAISTEDEYPTGASSDDQLVTYFEDRFVANIQNGIRPLRRDGRFGGAQAFWSFVRKRAKELGVANPGADYALTEIVRCKSNGEAGVLAARSTCTDLYLKRTLAASKAHTLITLGVHAEHELRRLVGVHGAERVVGPIEVCGHQRMIAFIPHANAREDRTFGKLLDPNVLKQLRGWTTKSAEPAPA